MRHFWLSALFFLATVPLTDFATAVVPWDDMRIKHTWHTIPVNWESLGHPSAGSTIDLDIVLEPDQESAMIDAISEISDPKHPRYRAYLSKEQVEELVRPSPYTLELVNAWLTHHGIRSSSISMSHGGTWLTVTDVRVSQASQFLGAAYQLYRNIKTNETIIRTVGYSLPAILHTHIQTVTPTTYFSSLQVTLQTPHRRTFGPEPAQAQAQAQAASAKLGTVLARQAPSGFYIPTVQPSDLRWSYGMTEYEPAAYNPGQNTLAVVGSGPPSQHDLTEFMKAYRTKGQGATFVTVIGEGYPNEFPDEESNVAVQYASAMAYPTPLFVFEVVPNGNTLMMLVQFLLAMQPLPRTISFSFNFFEEGDLPRPDVFYLCKLFIQFGVRGSIVLVASGDDGVGAGDCLVYDSGFPSSCPWVTSVGGTEGLSHMYGEVATPNSGGGFSRFFSRPAYQDLAVHSFFKMFDDDLDDEDFNRYNSEGRGFPDISAQAFGCRIFQKGKPDIARGTACAVSTAAGIISLLNDFMISTRPADEEPDKAPLGFLNTWLYSDEVLSIPALNDIIGGSNPGCRTPGFSAIKGWDPVTGLGTLNFKELLGILQRRRGLQAPRGPP